MTSEVRETKEAPAKTSEEQDMIGDIIIHLERAESLLAYLLRNSPYSWTSEHYEKEGWFDVIMSFEQTRSFLEITEEYLEGSIEKARQLEDILYK